MNQFTKDIRFKQRSGFRSNVVPCFGLGRTNGERISDLKNYGVDSEPCTLPSAFDNDDVPTFTVDEHVNYNVERRRNIVGSTPSYISRPDPIKDQSVDNADRSTEATEVSTGVQAVPST